MLENHSFCCEFPLCARFYGDSNAEAKKYWAKAAAHQHALATDGLAYMAQCRGDAWEDAVRGWKKTLQLCFLPSTAYSLGVVHDPLQNAAGT